MIVNYFFDLCSDNVRGTFLEGSHPPRQLNGKEEVRKWMQDFNSLVSTWTIQWRDLQYVKESSKIYETRKNTFTFKDGKQVVIYVAGRHVLVQGKITEFELVLSVDPASFNQNTESHDHLSSETGKLIT